MWCVSCHTTFNYLTGCIEKTIIHNPHYHEWQRHQSNTLMLEQENINRNVDVNHISIHIQLFWNKANIVDNSFNDTYARIFHHFDKLTCIFEHYDINAIEVDDDKPSIIHVNANIRSQWILGEISESYFKNKLLCHEIKNLYNSNHKYIYNNTLNMFNAVSRKILKSNEEEEVRLYSKEYIKISKLYKKQMSEVLDMYKKLQKLI
jgi:hypothetical protein